MKMELNFSLAHATNTFHQAIGFVVLLADADYILEFGPGRNAEGGLVDGLVPGIQLGDNKVACSAKRQHPSSIGIVIRSQASEAGQESVVQVDDAAPREFPACIRR
jgi:hypothetical protein